MHLQPNLAPQHHHMQLYSRGSGQSLLHSLLPADTEVKTYWQVHTGTLEKTWPKV